jgi:hypothetical protein
MHNLDEYKNLYEYIIKVKSKSKRKDYKKKEIGKHLLKNVLEINKAKLIDLLDYANNNNLRGIIDIKTFWEVISKHREITLNIIDQNLDKPWNWYHISQHPNIKWSDIKNNINKNEYNWDYNGLSERKDLDLKYVTNNINKPWNWCSLSFNNINWDFVSKNLNKPWNWFYISQHPNIKWSDIKNNLDNPGCKWKWKYISNNPNINCKIINANLDKPWNWQVLSYNFKNITEEFLIKNLDKPWDFSQLVKHPNISYKTIINSDRLVKGLYIPFAQNPNFNFNLIDKVPPYFKYGWAEISQHPNIVWSDIINNPNFKWDWDYVSLNPNISFKIVSENLDRAWNWDFLSSHPNVEVTDIIDTFYDKRYKWNPKYVSKNPNITWTIIKNNIRSNKAIKWYWVDLLNNDNYNSFYFISENHEKKLVRQFLDKCWLELINKVCRPDRLFNWNEFACDEFPEEYKNECCKNK